MQSIYSEIHHRQDHLKALILDSDSINSVDSSGIHALKDLIDYCKEQEIELYFTGVKGVVRDAFQRTKIFDRLGEDHFALRLQHAVNHFDRKEYQNFKHYALQNNVVYED